MFFSRRSQAHHYERNEIIDDEEVKTVIARYFHEDYVSFDKKIKTHNSCQKSKTEEPGQDEIQSKGKCPTWPWSTPNIIQCIGYKGYAKMHNEMNEKHNNTLNTINGIQCIEGRA